MKQLQRQLGLTSVIAISTSTMLGSGIFVLPGLAAAKAGPAVWLAYIVAGLCVIPAALSKAELAVAMPESGGTYVYLDRTFGPLVGTIAGIGLWLSLLLKSAFALVGFTAYLLVLADLPIRSTALVFLAFITVLNVWGVLRVSQVQMVVVGAALFGLLGLAIAGATSMPADMVDPLATEAGGFLAAVGFVFVSYAGVTKIAAIAEEVRDPDRNLPLGIVLSLLLVMVIYGVLSFMLVAHLPMAELTGDLHPVYSLANTLGGHAIGLAFAVLGILTMTSMANAGLLAASRFPFAMSRDQLLPAVLRRLHRRFLTPVASILVSALLMGVAILLLDVERIAKIASAFVIMLYMGVNLAVVVLREAGVQWYKPRFRAPLYPWLQLFGMASGLLLLAMMGTLGIVAGAVIALPGTLLFFGYGRRNIERRGVLKQRGRRHELVSASGRESAPSPDVHAEVVVTLFGSERSPELLVLLGGSLADSGRVHVALVTELPEQTALDAADDDRKVRSIQRRLMAVAQAEDLDIHYQPIASRDIIRTASELSSHPSCQWLVLAWAGRSRESLTFRNPLGWLKDHLSCNVATFHDAGVRHIREILVHVEPGPHDALVVKTAEHLAGVHGAALTFVRFVPDDDPLKAQSEADYLDQIHQLVSVPSQVRLLRGSDEAQALGDASIDYDLLVTAEAPRGRWLGRLRGHGRDRMTANAACSVLRLQRPRQAVHSAAGQLRSEPRGTIELRPSRLLDPRCVGVNLSSTRKDELFQHFAASLAEIADGLRAEEIAAALRHREATQNTAVGDGVALPHATITTAQQSYFSIFTAKQAVDYQAPDDQPVDVFFVTMGAPRQRNTHLLLLAEISKLVLKTPLLDQLRRADSADDVVRALKQCEQLLDQPPS